MSVIFLALPVAIALAGAALLAFVWAVRQGQFDDLSSPPFRMLFEDDAGARPVPEDRSRSAARCRRLRDVQRAQDPVQAPSLHVASRPPQAHVD